MRENKVFRVSLITRRYSTPRGQSLDMKKLYTFAVKARNELAVWLSSLPATLKVDMVDLDRKHLPHVLQLQ